METAQRLISTRKGTILLSVIAAAVAGGLILVYVSRYRNSVNTQNQQVAVFIASKLIPKGTAGSVIAEKGLYQRTTVPRSKLLDGAISDPSLLRNEVATQAIYPDAQLTTADFAPASTNLAASLTATQRIVSVPFSSAQGLSGDLQVGDHVDVYAGFNVSPVGSNGFAVGGGNHAVVRRILTNVPVVAIAGKTSGTFTSSGNANLSFQLTDYKAQELTFAANNGTLWLALRPATGAKSKAPSIVTIETLLLGVPPQTILHSLGARR